MDSYKNSHVRIWSVRSVSRPIDLKKGVKQGCPLSPLLVNICMDLLISYLRKASDLGYDIEELNSSVIHAYTDEMILVSNYVQNFQTLINRVNIFSIC
jgi:hypothetical protein